MLDETAESVSRNRADAAAIIWARPAIRTGAAEKDAAVGVVNGLAWTSVGGEMLTVECAGHAWKAAPCS